MNKKPWLLFIIVGILAASPALAQTDIQRDPAYLPIEQVLDLKAIQPKVNINLPRFLLLNAASDFDGGPNDPLAKTGISFKELVKDIKLIRLVVIEGGKETQAALEKAVATLRKQVEGKWTTIVSVPDGNVGIYALGDGSGEQMEGLALLVCNHGHAVIGNVVGRVSIGKVLKIAMQMDSFPKDLLGKLSAVQTRATNSQTGTSKEDEETKPKPAK